MNCALYVTIDDEIKICNVRVTVKRLLPFITNLVQLINLY